MSLNRVSAQPKNKSRVTLRRSEFVVRTRKSQVKKESEAMTGKSPESIVTDGIETKANEFFKR